MKKNSIKLILGMVMILMFLCTNITAFAYSDSCTVGPIAAGTSAPGYLTLNPYVGLGKNLNVSITDGLYDMDYSSTVKVVVTRIARKKSYSFSLGKVNYAASLPVSFAGSGDYRVTAYNGAKVPVSVHVYWEK